MATATDFLSNIGTAKNSFSKVNITSANYQIERLLYAFGAFLVQELQTNLGKHNASGALSESIKFTITAQGKGGFNFELSLLDYYKWVDIGRKPGKFPPPAAILAWLGYKGINPSAITAKAILKGGHRIKPLSNIAQMKTLAFLIGRKIAKKGIPATNFYSSVVNDTTIEKLRRALAAALRRDILISISKEQ